VDGVPLDRWADARGLDARGRLSLFLRVCEARRSFKRGSPVDRVALRGGSGRVYDLGVPLETMVERETVPFTHALRVQVARYFLKLHSPAQPIRFPCHHVIGCRMPRQAHCAPDFLAVSSCHQPQSSAGIGRGRGMVCTPHRSDGPDPTFV